MLELRDITFRYDDKGPVLDRAGFTIEDGELLLLAGPTGVGKSTLLGVVAGLVPSYTGGTLSGDVLLDGRSIIDQPARDRAHAIGYVGQNPPSWFVTDTVEEELAFGMEQLGLAPATMRRRVEETLDLLGIADLRARDLRTLSGGQQQRVAIGSVLTTHPRLLVLDEPTSALDPTAAEEVLATLTRLVHDTGVSVLVAEHRLERVVPFADRICLMGADPSRPGTVVVGDPAVVLATGPIAPPIVELGRLAGWSPLPLSVRDARRRSGELRERLAVVDPADSPPGHQVRREPLVEARGLAVLHGRTAALRRVDLTLDAGTVTALMGRNGAGKSTLMWTLQGRHTPTRGTTQLDGRPGLVPQSPADLLYLETVAEECAEADRAARATRGTCRGLLDRLAPGIPDDQHPRDLSEGQRLALAVAIVLTPKPRVLLLDEPTRGLDYAAKHQLAQVLKELATEPGVERAILVATHDVEFVAQAADRMVVLAEGEVVSSGPVRQVITESPAFAPQVTKVLGPGWLSVAEVESALAVAR